MKHGDIWRALDTLAARHRLSASGLARRAGLDATTFNLSKRSVPGGRLRWPSTESLAKVLDATGTTLREFTDLVNGDHDQRTIPLIGFADAGKAGFFDAAGFPIAAGWDEIGLPCIDAPNTYALEISGNAMEPVYRPGDLVVVSPATPIRRGDRIVLRTRRGEVMAKLLVRQSSRRIELKSLNSAHSDLDLELAQVDWIHRIIWARQ